MKKHLRTLGLMCFIFFSLINLFPARGYSQSLIFGGDRTSVEVGINVGPSFFLGDLGGNQGKGTRFIKDVNLDLTKIMKGVFVAVYPNGWLGIRAAAQLGKLEGDDNIIETKGVDELWRKQRNLDFRSDIFEAYVAFEFFPIMLLNGNNPDYKPRFRPYGVIGAGMLKFNPQGSLTDGNGVKTWHYLKPLHIEGQGFDEYPDRKEYSLTQINIPMGVGFKYFLSERTNISLELLLRKSFTDYIDDVSTTYIDPNLYDKYLPAADARIARQISDKMYGIVTPSVARYSPGTQRGNAGQNDSYFTTFLKFGVRLGPIYEDSRSRRAAHNMRCPITF